MKNLIFFFTILFLAIIPPRLLKATDGLSLSVETEEGSRNYLDFGRLETIRAGELVSDSSVVRVKVSIINTTGHQYKVTQRLSGPLLNEKDFQLPAETLSFFCLGANVAGRLFNESPSSLSYDEEVIFISDAQGKDDTFYIQYCISPPLTTKSGRYRSNLIYRVIAIE